MTVIFGDGYTLPSGDQPLTHARIAHSLNWLSGGSVSASSTSAGYYVDAPDNSLTYELWQPSETPGIWRYDHGSSAIDQDYCAIAAHTLGTSGSVIKAAYWTGTQWVDLCPPTAITDDSPILIIFEPTTSERWRIQIPATTSLPTIGVIKFGRALQMQQAIYGGHSPINLARQTVLRSNLSETGEFLGRTKQRALLSTSYAWTHLSADWIRTNWPSLQKAVESEPFWIAWRPADYGEVGFSQADAVPIPQNMGIKDYMQVELTTRARAWD